MSHKINIPKEFFKDCGAIFEVPNSEGLFTYCPICLAIKEEQIKKVIEMVKLSPYNSD